MKDKPTDTAAEAALLEIITNGAADVSLARVELEVGEANGLEVVRLCDGLRGMLTDLVELAESQGKEHTNRFLSEMLTTVIAAGIMAEQTADHLQNAARVLGGVTVSQPWRFSDCIAAPKDETTTTVLSGPWSE
jgi:hypothetical protein